MNVRELIDILTDQPPDAEVELAVIEPLETESDDITVDRYPVDGVLPWTDDDDEGLVSWLIGGEDADVDAFLDAVNKTPPDGASPSWARRQLKTRDDAPPDALVRRCAPRWSGVGRAINPLTGPQARAMLRRAQISSATRRPRTAPSEPGRRARRGRRCRRGGCRGGVRTSGADREPERGWAARRAVDRCRRLCGGIDALVDDGRGGGGGHGQRQ